MLSVVAPVRERKLFSILQSSNVVFRGCYSFMMRNSAILGVAFSFGVGLMVTAWGFGRISGAHFNPAITLANLIVVSEICPSFSHLCSRCTCDFNEENVYSLLFNTIRERVSRPSSFEAVYIFVVASLMLCLSSFHPKGYPLLYLSAAGCPAWCCHGSRRYT